MTKKQEVEQLLAELQRIDRRRTRILKRLRELGVKVLG